ncbi:ATP-grasp domain-containing protein [Paraburkholderia sp. UCT31]|uniref:ATP-grasp domain-containing protein n=1 Tax=Paraburkholderia sp. UCT31 TaxID=2615209 RepID=UPI001654C39C|nr:ATP-grasp domain-containing protein [Paraburkholderia sp. UCT31]
MKPVVLFRSQFDQDGESTIAGRHLPVVGLRAAVPPESLVIGRYACLPYYTELAGDLAIHGSRLINTVEAHNYIADFEYYPDVEPHTFRTWESFAAIPQWARGGAFVVKGRTNSRKLQWRTHMFAPDFRSAVHLGAELMNDPFIGPQGLVIREYVPLETFEIGLNDVPMTNEWRLFFYRDELLAHGYYWSIIDDLTAVEKAKPDFLETGIPFARKLAAIVAQRAAFFVLDIAKTAAGEWVLVEVNDGQQAGVNEFIDVDSLYANLAKALPTV